MFGKVFMIFEEVDFFLNFILIAVDGMPNAIIQWKFLNCLPCQMSFITVKIKINVFWNVKQFEAFPLLQLWPDNITTLIEAPPDNEYNFYANQIFKIFTGHCPLYPFSRHNTNSKINISNQRFCNTGNIWQKQINIQPHFKIKIT